MDLRNLPWHAIRETFFLIRRAGFARDPPDVPGVIVSNPSGETRPLADRIERLLGARYFEPDEWSYYYYDETINLRRAFCDDDRIDGLRWHHDHVRGFDHPAGLMLVAHLEPEPIAHPKAHLSDNHVDWEAGLERLMAVLDAADEPYTPVSPDT